MKLWFPWLALNDSTSYVLFILISVFYNFDDPLLPYVDCGHLASAVTSLFLSSFHLSLTPSLSRVSALVIISFVSLPNQSLISSRIDSAISYHWRNRAICSPTHPPLSCSIFCSSPHPLSMLLCIPLQSITKGSRASVALLGILLREVERFPDWMWLAWRSI